MSDRAEEVAEKVFDECAHNSTLYEWWGPCKSCVASALRAYAEEAVRVWRGDLWLAHGHSGLIYGDDGEMACSACGVDYKREPNSSRVVAAALHARAEEASQQAMQEQADALTADFSERVDEAVEEARREEREACAVVAEYHHRGDPVNEHPPECEGECDVLLVAAAIRAREEMMPDFSIRKDFPKGARVQAIRAESIKWMRRKEGDVFTRHGTVVGWCRDGAAVRVLWDGLTTPQEWHRDFLERADA